MDPAAGALRRDPGLGEAVSAETIDPAFHSEIQKLLELTGSGQIANQLIAVMTKQIFDGLKRSRPSIPDRALEVARETIETEFGKMVNGPDSVQEQIIAVYARHFTPEEVRGLIAFYSSKLGSKVRSTLPVLLQESMAIGQQWAQTQMPKIAATLETRLRAEGFK